MDITVFGNYKVEFKGEYIYLNEEKEYIKNKYSYKVNKNGGELLEIISKELKDSKIIQFTGENNVIYFEKFNPQTGEGSNTLITILEEVKE